MLIAISAEAYNYLYMDIQYMQAIHQFMTIWISSSLHTCKALFDRAALFQDGGCVDTSLYSAAAMQLYNGFIGQVLRMCSDLPGR